MKNKYFVMFFVSLITISSHLKSDFMDDFGGDVQAFGNDVSGAVQAVPQDATTFVKQDLPSAVKHTANAIKEVTDGLKCGIGEVVKFSRQQAEGGEWGMCDGCHWNNGGTEGINLCQKRFIVEGASCKTQDGLYGTCYCQQGKGCKCEPPIPKPEDVATAGTDLAMSKITEPAKLLNNAVNIVNKANMFVNTDADAVTKLSSTSKTPLQDYVNSSAETQIANTVGGDPEKLAAASAVASEIAKKLYDGQLNNPHGKASPAGCTPITPR